MAVIEPFKGLIFNNQLISNPGDVITPPYDVITAEEQDNLHHRSPYNIIRLEYGKIYSEDNEITNRYSRAEECLNLWLKDQILMPQAAPAFYLYEQLFRYNNIEYTRRGFFAALKLEDYRSKAVLPHELTMSAPKADRRELLARLKTNISPIFTLFPDPEEIMPAFFNNFNNLPPLIEAAEVSGQVHRLWALTDLSLQQKLSDYLAGQPLLIADGHHRYETALAYANETSGNKNRGSGHILAALVSMKDPGLLVLPTHRLISGLSRDQKYSLKKLMSERFQILDRGRADRLDQKSFIEELAVLNREIMTLGYLDSEQAAILITPKNKNSSAISVEILHRELLKPVIAPGGENDVDQSALSYEHDIDGVVRSIMESKADAAFILDPVPAAEVLKKAEKGEVMPQKSTYFYPKLPGGLVLHHHRLSY